jgi:hypothetical protein
MRAPAPGKRGGEESAASVAADPTSVQQFLMGFLLGAAMPENG